MTRCEVSQLSRAGTARMKLSGKKVVVTGASSGVGLALVKQLDRRGSRVMVVGRIESCARMVADLRRLRLVFGE